MTEFEAKKKLNIFTFKVIFITLKILISIIDFGTIEDKTLKYN